MVLMQRHLLAIMHSIKRIRTRRFVIVTSLLAACAFLASGGAMADLSQATRGASETKER